MATQHACSLHGGQQAMIFCRRCFRTLCPECLEKQATCERAGSQPHDYLELRQVPNYLRDQLGAIQAGLRREQTALREQERNCTQQVATIDTELSTRVAKVTDSADERLQVLDRLRAFIRANTTHTQ